ncbi:hypothetical protein MAR_011197 [Mya arenaria]|uniref:Uncharacterized protein n=1 Tax=Mya arenaria TaxID=6604 RepID=A0ABY7FX83_MYAAR|nr:hypothetical protein MAR_011197 [Mya arenaria]
MVNHVTMMCTNERCFVYIVCTYPEEPKPKRPRGRPKGSKTKTQECLKKRMKPSPTITEGSVLTYWISKVS